MKEAFDSKNYKLYRSLYDLLHPTISRKNITSYKIVLDDSLVPLRVFYPSKNTKLEQIIIYVHGDSKEKHLYETLCKNIALETDSLVLAIDYKENIEKECYNMIRFILNNITDVSYDKVALMGDTSGADIVLKLTTEEEISINKQIVICPTLNDVPHKIKKKIPTTLFIRAELDQNQKKQEKYIHTLKKHNPKSEYNVIENTTSDFFGNPNNKKQEECLKIIRNFMI